jgi:gamma-glutamyl-gamma-aminobutyrate hydrolase PuuD
MPKVYIVGDDRLTTAMFRKRGWGACSSIENPDLVCFTGGEDVSPEFYGEENTHSYNNILRDLEEELVFQKFFNTPKVGICRGGQFLNVMSGGKMIQHVEGHTRNHLLMVRTDLKIPVTSTHHQMMQPGKHSKLIAVADHDKGIEVVWYEVTRSLCFQPHPEYDMNSEMTSYFFSLIFNHFYLEA